MTVALSIDPGEHTGLGYYGPDGVVFTSVDDYLVTCNLIHAYLRGDYGVTVDVVYIERFNIGAGTLKKSRNGKVSIELIGVVRWLCGIYNIRMVEQNPSDAALFSKKDKLDKIGWTPLLKGHKGDHALSAARHLLLGLVNDKLIDARILL